MLKRIASRSSLGQLTLAVCLTTGISAAFAAEFPSGSYAATGQTLTVTFDDKGKFRVTKNGVMEVAGRYIVKGDEVVFTDQEGPWACTNTDEQTGTYRWKYDNAALTFSKVADRCEGRVRSMISAAWKRQN
jgi:hypothetical protein